MHGMQGYVDTDLNQDRAHGLNETNCIRFWGLGCFVLYLVNLSSISDPETAPLRDDVRFIGLRYISNDY